MTLSLDWTRAARLLTQIGFVSSTILCLLLNSLTLLEMRKKFGSYAWLLVYFSTIGIVFATLELILYPNVHTYNAGFIFFASQEFVNFQKETITLLLTIYGGTYASTISLLSVQFIYRYLAIFSAHKLKYFQSWYFLLWILYSSFFGFLWTVTTYFLTKTDNFTADYFADVLMENYGLSSHTTPALAVVAYYPNGDVRWKGVIGISSMQFVVGFQYVVISYCGFIMYRKMGEKLEMVSKSVRDLHQQFFKTLMLQIITPTMILFIPVLIINSLPLLNLKIDMPAGIFTCILTLYPAMDAVIIMVVVKDYRRVLKKYSRACSNGGSLVAVIGLSSTNIL